MTNRLDGPQDPRGGDDAARGSSSGPNHAHGASLDLSDGPPPPADAEAAPGTTSPAKSEIGRAHV